QLLGLDEATLNWSTAREVVSCFEAHGVEFPPEASTLRLGLIVAYASWMWGRWFSSEDMQVLTIGTFLSEVLEVMGLRGDDEGVAEAGRTTKPKLAIFSGHDSTLVPVLCALKLYDDTWPPYSR
ncbi:unnamed protein product, partial [Discosporangium mesarthrocarpum]